jgi:tripartite-type tricarboxylate transporter receptor subunit TctC
MSLRMSPRICPESTPMTNLVPSALIQRRSVIATAALAVLAPVSLRVGAQAPSAQVSFDKPLKLILPVGAGSGVDGIVRAAANALGRALGQGIAIENQPGAGGVVGTAAMIKSAPDGNTLSFVSNNHVIYPSVLKAVPFDPVADITPIALIGATPLVLVVNKDLPAKTLQEFVALLKANPGKYNYASSGNGTILHLAAELFKDVTGTFSTHIPYRGFGPMLTDIISGQVQWGVGALPAVLGQVKAGNLRALCVSAPARTAAAPDIPTSSEGGAPLYLVEGWIAVVGPKGLPLPQVNRIHAALVTAFGTAEVKEAMAKQGNAISVSTPEVAAAHFKDELVRYAGLVKKSGMKPD